MTDRGCQPVGEIDLLAYADGLLDQDPVRRAQVEAYLRAHPAEAERVADYAEQNAEIRALYDHVLGEPAPDRLHRVLQAQSGGVTAGALLRAAVAAGLLLAAGTGGWWLGRSTGPDAWPLQSFVEQAINSYAAGPSQASAMTDDGLMQPLHRLSESIALELQAPDLSGHGFELVGKRLVSSGTQPVVQLVYAGLDGQRLTLFVRARWEDSPSTLQFAKGDHATMAYWLDGPLVYGLVGDLAPQKMRALAETIRRSVRLQSRQAGAQPDVNPVAPALVQPMPKAALGSGDRAPAVPYISPLQPIKRSAPAGDTADNM